MAKRIFLLASLSALAAVGMVGGCSSESPVVTVADAGTDAGDSGSTPRDASVEEPETGPAVCPSTLPITPSDLLPWKPPPAIQSACTQENVDALKVAFKNSSSVKFSDIKTLLGTTCSACVFSNLNVDGGPSPNWSIFVETTNGSAVDNRTASCFARLQGETCGKTRFQFESCLRAACPLSDCGTDAKVKTCLQASQKGACKAITADYVAACPNESNLLAACNLYASIAASCGGGADAGIDAAAP